MMEQGDGGHEDSWNEDDVECFVSRRSSLHVLHWVVMILAVAEVELPEVEVRLGYSYLLSLAHLL